jgi:hypothetical protein
LTGDRCWRMVSRKSEFRMKFPSNLYDYEVPEKP